MEYIYAALLLHKAGKKVDEHGVKAVLTAAGVAADESRIKALIAALDGVNIEEAISKAAAAPVAVAA
ncbi:MAG: 50S ribosomal protein L12, partial [Methanoregula sp.]